MRQHPTREPILSGMNNKRTCFQYWSCFLVLIYLKKFSWTYNFCCAFQPYTCQCSQLWQLCFLNTISSSVSNRFGAKMLVRPHVSPLYKHLQSLIYVVFPKFLRSWTFQELVMFSRGCSFLAKSIFPAHCSPLHLSLFASLHFWQAGSAVRPNYWPLFEVSTHVGRFQTKNKRLLGLLLRQIHWA